MPESERRRHTRYRVHGFSSFGSDQIRGSGQIYNVSATGCAIGTRCDVPLGSHLRMSLQLGKVEPVVIETAVVRWVRHYQFGVEFLLADTEQVTRLGACLHGLQRSDSTITQ